MTYVVQTPPSSRIGGIAVVVLLHVIIIYALLNGLGSAVVDVLRGPLQAQVIAPVKPPNVPPPPPPVIQPPPPYIPPPLIQTAPPPDVAPVIAAVATVRPPAPAAPVARAATLNVNQACQSAVGALEDDVGDEQDANPGLQLHRTIAQFYIGADGAVEQAHVAVSSGDPVLDGDLIHELSRCKFNPAIGANGQPQAMWVSQPYDWTN